MKNFFLDGQCLGMHRWLVYSHLAAAEASDQKLSGLKQHKFITLQFWKSEVQTGSYWSRIKVLAELHPFGRLWGRTAFLPFPTSKVGLHSLACGLFLHLQSQRHSIFQSLWFWSPSCDDTEPAQIIQDILPQESELNHIFKDPFAR